VEIKIGVHDHPRELAIDSEESVEAIEGLVRAAITTGEVLRLTDSKDRTVLVPADKIAFVEITPATRGRVGFGSPA
jgi:hypothetical protein